MNNQSQDALISESASENKRRRGRPTVFQRDHMEGMEKLCTADKHRTRRSHVADYYRGSVFGILEDHSDIPYLEGIFRIDGNACIEKCEIIEQLGRMHVQDGYDEDNENYNDPDFEYFKRRYPPYKPKAFPLLYEIEELEFTIEHSHDIGKIYVALLFLVIIRTFELLHEIKEEMLLSVQLRHEERDLKQYISDYHFMKNNDIETLEDLHNDIEKTKAQISELEHQRIDSDNKRRRAKTPGDIDFYKEKRKEITKQITPLRKRLKQAEKIWDKSPHLLELVKQEQSLEIQAKQKIKFKEWSR